MRFPAHGFLFYDEEQTNQETRNPGKEIENSETFLHSCLPYSPLLGFLASRFIPLLMSEPRNSNGSSPNPENPVNPVSTPLPNSSKVYVPGETHPDLRVPFREISLAPTKTVSGEIEVNEPVRVYDTSGPWGDPDFHGDVERGLPPLRAGWIRVRGDVEEIEGRAVTPIDDGYLSATHAAHANGS